MDLFYSRYWVIFPILKIVSFFPIIMKKFPIERYKIKKNWIESLKIIEIMGYFTILVKFTVYSLCSSNHCKSIFSQFLTKYCWNSQSHEYGSYSQILEKNPCKISKLLSTKNTYSPKIRTAVTETKMAVTGSDIRSRNIGMASTAAALPSNKVTSNRWCLFTIGIILCACFFSLGVPPSFKTFKVIMSSERSPMVKPDISPAMVNVIPCYLVT